MRVYATASMKGGVGKTAAAVNLAHVAAAHGARTLLWDLDPQGASSFYYRIRPRVRRGAKKLVRGKTGLADHVRATDYPGLDLVPADLSFRKLDVLLHDRTKKPRKALGDLLAPVADEYDVVLLDTPPGLTLTNEAIIFAVDVLLVPVVPNALTLRTLAPLAEHLAKRAEKGDEVPTLLPFFSMVDRRKNIHKETVASPPAGFPFLDTHVPFSSAVERMELERAPLVALSPTLRPAVAFRRLWKEILNAS